MNKLTTLYSSVLESLNCTIEEDGTILLRDATDINGQAASPMYIKVDGVSRKLVLPTAKVLRDGDWDSIVAFHPACESIVKGRSLVMNQIVNLVGLALTIKYQQAILDIYGLAINKKVHKQLRNKQHQYLISPLPPITSTSTKYLEEVLAKDTGLVGAHKLLSIRLNRGGNIGSESYQRVCELIPNVLDSDPINGVKGSKNNQLLVRKLYELAMPRDIVVGSNSIDHPYLDTVLGVYGAALSELNKLHALLGKHAKHLQATDVKWLEDLPNMHKFAQSTIPQVLPFNAGEDGPADNDSEPVKVEPVIEPVKVAPTKASLPDNVSMRTGIVEPHAVPRTVNNAPTLPITPAPSIPTVAAPVDTDKPLSTAELIKRGSAPMISQPGYPQQPQYYQQPQYQQPQQQYQPQQPQYYQQSQYQHPQQPQPYQQPNQPGTRPLTRGDYQAMNYR